MPRVQTSFLDTPGPPGSIPLAERMRPRELADIVGQSHLLGPEGPLGRLIESGRVPSMILWGPPGSGKTTLARILETITSSRLVMISAVESGIREMREVIHNAKILLESDGQRTILFIDEIHRFNKAQQDALLPHVEHGTVIMVGATTENPSFEVISALLSRCRVFVLEPLSPENLQEILRRAWSTPERGLGLPLDAITDDALETIVAIADGDARIALNLLEQVADLRSAEKGEQVTTETVKRVAQLKSMRYDKDGEEHYNIISALHKSLRESDPDAALYWLARMLVGGEDPMYILRRMIRFAAEDVGLANPQALILAIAARDTYHFLGSPEGELALAELAIYLATAPKSNAVYSALSEAMRDAREQPAYPVPLTIRNAPTGLMSSLGYGKGYRYAHEYEDHISGISCLPPELADRSYYRPSKYGYEPDVAERMRRWAEIRKKRRDS